MKITVNTIIIHDDDHHQQTKRLKILHKEENFEAKMESKNDNLRFSEAGGI